MKMTLWYLPLNEHIKDNMNMWCYLTDLPGTPLQYFDKARLLVSSVAESRTTDESRHTKHMQVFVPTVVLGHFIDPGCLCL